MVHQLNVVIAFAEDVFVFFGQMAGFFKTAFFAHVLGQKAFQTARQTQQPAAVLGQDFFVYAGVIVIAVHPRHRVQLHQV